MQITPDSSNDSPFEEGGGEHNGVDSYILYPETDIRDATGDEDFCLLIIQTCGQEVETCCLMALVFMTS